MGIVNAIPPFTVSQIVHTVPTTHVPVFVHFLFNYVPSKATNSHFINLLLKPIPEGAFSLERALLPFIQCHFDKVIPNFNLWHFISPCA